jgi:hypothetical protein
MLKIRVALLGVLVLLISSGIAASAASAAGPFWHVNGTKFTKGSKQNTLQNKMAVVLTSEVGTVPVVIACTTSESEGATIEGNGSNQGQDKGRLKFTGCKVEIANCTVVEPITTSLTKSHLVTFKGGSQTKYADLLEPSEGTVFATVKIIKSTEACPVATVLEVKGSIAAEIYPKEHETKEGLLNFPSIRIGPVFLEGVEKTPGLFVGTKEAKFLATYGSKLVTGETFGVFST